jgi:hypothetical protein
MVAEWHDDEERIGFLNGLSDVDQRSQSLFGTGFLEAEPAQQDELLRGLEAEAVALREAGENSSRLFWPRMKGLTLYGYFTSELVQREVLQTVISPGRYDGCVTM